ncbi:hypothetical protein ECG_03374 [Echinococcus granulosus]|nr:hypothetical protein ECG_03374 [Echinococcus granulosus]
MVVGLLGLVGGIEAYVFEPPSSLYLIFNPIEFLNICVKKFEKFGDIGAYGVDLLRARALFEDGLRDILRCGVKPIPIFGGLSNESGLGVKSVANRYLKSRKNYKEADLDVAAARYRAYGDFFPCARQFVTNCLRDLDLCCVQSSYDSMPVCLGIAYCLDCPIASMSSQYYVISRPTILPEEIQTLTINEMKLVDLTTDFYRMDKEEGKAVLKLKVYHPELSALCGVPATSRPLIALLMNSDLLPRLPAAIKVEPSGSDSYTSAKLRAVIDWVAKTNPIHVLQAIMESITDPKYIDYISSSILLYLRTFCPDFVEASKVLRVLGLGQWIPPIKAPIRRVEEEKEHPHQRPSSPMLFFQTAAGLLKGTVPADRPVDFLYRWPAALVHLYRSNTLQRLFIAPLYSKFGVVFICNNDYLIELPYVYGPSRILRYVHYCLLMGVEEANGLSSKLVGLRPHAKEICYEGNFRFKTYMVEVKPMQLPRNCTVDDFIHTIIGLDRTIDVPDWSVALVLSCVLWHQEKVEHRDCDIAECPLILSVLVLAVATRYNVKCGVPVVAEHYDTLKSLVLTKMKESGAFPNAAVEKKLMHSALELMTMYDHYVSLCRLLTALQEGSGTPDFSSAAYNRFPPNYAIFPSLALLVYMAAHLKCEKTPSAVAVRLWLVNAFLHANNDASDVARLKDALTEFSTLQKLVSED